MDIKPYQSLSAYIFSSASSHFGIEETDALPKKIAKVCIETTVFSLIALIGLVETIARHAFLFICKSVQFFIPKKYAKKFNEAVLFPALHHAQLSFGAYGKSLARIVLKSKTIQFLANRKIDIALDNFYFHSKAVKNFCNFHFNGLNTKSISSRNHKSFMEKIMDYFITSDFMEKVYYSPLGPPIFHNPVVWKVFNKLFLG